MRKTKLAASLFIVLGLAVILPVFSSFKATSMKAKAETTIKPNLLYTDSFDSLNLSQDDDYIYNNSNIGIAASKAFEITNDEGGTGKLLKAKINNNNEYTFLGTYGHEYLNLLEEGARYRFQTKIDPSHLSEGSRLFIEYESDVWTGITITRDGKVSPCEGINIFNLSYKAKVLSFDFIATRAAKKNYVKFTTQSAKSGDYLLFDDISIAMVRTSPYDFTFENDELDAYQNANVYKETVVKPTLEIVGDENNHSLEVSHSSTETAWPFFYFNQLKALKDHKSYRLSFDILTWNFVNIYVSYNDGNINQATVNSSSKSASVTVPGEQLLDAGLLNEKTFFFEFKTDSALSNEFYKQVRICIQHEASQEKLVRIDNVRFSGLDDYGVELNLFTADAKLDYFVGDSLDLSGLGVTLKRADGYLEGLDADDYSLDLSSLDMNVAGTYNVSLKVVDEFDNVLTKSFFVKVRDDTLQSLSLTKPLKTTYFVGEELDPTGLEVEATYLSGRKVKVESYAILPVDTSLAGEKEVVVTYLGKRASFFITVRNDAIEELTLTLPNKLSYAINEELDLTGLTVEARFLSEKKRQLNESEYVVSGYDKTKEGQQRITVTASGVSNSFMIEVIDDVVGIRMGHLPTKTDYLLGEDIDVSGASIIVIKKSGAEVEIPLAKEMILGFDNEHLGPHTISVSYHEFETTFEVQVVSSSKSQTVLVVSLISGASVLALGAGGFFGFRYLFRKKKKIKVKGK